MVTCKLRNCRTGQISEEEKARRLAEMSGNADAHEEARWARLQAARKRDEVEAEAEALALQKKATQSMPILSHFLVLKPTYLSHLMT